MPVEETELRIRVFLTSTQDGGELYISTALSGKKALNT
jgi:hypothetical protein